MRLLFQNVLGRAPDTEGLAGWTALPDGGTSPAEVVRGFLQSREFVTASALGLNDMLVGGSGDNGSGAG